MHPTYTLLFPALIPSPPFLPDRRSKLKRLLGMVRYMMEDTMRVLVDRSLQGYVSYVVSNCASRLTVKSTAVVEVVATNAATDSAAMHGGAHAHRRPPLLQIELQAAKEGTHFHYSVQLDSVILKFATLFDHAIQKLQVRPGVGHPMRPGGGPQDCEIHCVT